MTTVYHNPRISPKDRILNNTDRSSGCWIWQLSVRKDGYGQFKLSGVNTTAHRASYKTFVGPIPDGMFVLHTCDTKLCVNPEHLFLGTQLDNMRDMIAKGRKVAGGAKGEKSAKSKLTEDKVRMIRLLHTKNIGPTELSKRYGVAKNTIVCIVNHKYWKHVL